MTNPSLPVLPLLLWGTPPGLEQVLMQEGVPFRKLADVSPQSLAAGRFVLFDSQFPAKSLRAVLSQEHVPVDIGREDFADLIDLRATRKVWTVEGYRLAERVAKVDKADVRRRVISRLRSRIEAAGGVWARLATYPHPYRSAFNFRADLDEPFPDDYAAFARARRPIDDCSTHFVSTAAYANSPDVLDDLRRVDTQSHGHFHVIYRSEAANRRNLERAHNLLHRHGFTPTAFAAPEGRWNPGLDRAMESLGYAYSSDFSIGYDDLPFAPWIDGRHSKVLQIPVHPICEGLFLDAGCDDPDVMARHLIATVRAKVENGDPAFVYGHPERRLGRFPQVISALADAVGELDRVWRVTLTEFARWWTWRAAREWSLVAVAEGRYEVRFANWDASYPLGLEIVRGDRTSSIRLSGPRQIVVGEDVGTRRVRADEPRPSLVPPSRGWKSAVRAALDWETVTPVDELLSDGLRDRLKTHLRKFKSQGNTSVQLMEKNFSDNRISEPGGWDFDAGSPKIDAQNCVLVHAPSFAFQAPGGGENQLIQTSRHLQDMGTRIRPFSPWDDRISESRLLHLYGMSREGLELARVARAGGVPVALSTICWFEPRAIAALAPNGTRRAFDLAKWSARKWLPRLPDWRRHLLDLADVILPNSRAEARQLVELFGAHRRKIQVVPNGVDPRFASASPDLFRERFGDMEFVLYAGRIEPRKNVLGLIQAARMVGLPLVVIGATVPGHEAYADRCRREGRGEVTWMGRVDHADPLLESAMAAARVFALPSWFETPGLAALEAAAAGCAIVITPYGCTREYFGDSVEYARPGSRGEIADALGRAWKKRPQCPNEIVSRYSWSIVAQETKEAYDRIAP